MLNGYDPKTSIQLWPGLSMERFGLNPWGEPLYRIVLTDSRRFIVYGKWHDSGHPRAAWQLLYPHMLGRWVLESWRNAWDFTGMTAAQWNADPDSLMLGPYPSRGEYQMVGSDAFPPADTNIERLIAMVEDARNTMTWAGKLKACRTQQEYAEDTARKMRMDVILDALPYQGTEPLSGYGGGRGTKTAPVLKSANELHLPKPTTQANVNGGPRMMTPRQARRFGFNHQRVIIPA